MGTHGKTEIVLVPGGARVGPFLSCSGWWPRPWHRDRPRLLWGDRRVHTTKRWVELLDVNSRHVRHVNCNTSVHLFSGEAKGQVLSIGLCQYISCVRKVEAVADDLDLVETLAAFFNTAWWISVPFWGIVSHHLNKWLYEIIYDYIYICFNPWFCGVIFGLSLFVRHFKMVRIRPFWSGGFGSFCRIHKNVE